MNIDLKGLKDIMEEYLGKRHTKFLVYLIILWIVFLILRSIISNLAPLLQFSEDIGLLIRVSLYFISLILFAYAFYCVIRARTILRETKERMDEILENSRRRSDEFLEVAEKESEVLIEASKENLKKSRELFDEMKTIAKKLGLDT